MIGVGRTPKHAGVVLDGMSVSHEDVVIPETEVKDGVDKVLEDVYELLRLTKLGVVVVVQSLVDGYDEVLVKMNELLEVDPGEVNVGVFVLLATELLVELEARLKLELKKVELEAVVVVGSVV